MFPPALVVITMLASELGCVHSDGPREPNGSTLLDLWPNVYNRTITLDKLSRGGRLGRSGPLLGDSNTAKPVDAQWGTSGTTVSPPSTNYGGWRGPSASVQAAREGSAAYSRESIRRIHQRVRIEAIKSQILNKLGITNPPVINKTDIPKEVMAKAMRLLQKGASELDSPADGTADVHLLQSASDKTSSASKPGLQRARGRRRGLGRRRGKRKPPPSSEGYFAQISEIISFSEPDANSSNEDVLQFTLFQGQKHKGGGLRVTRATLNILLRYRKERRASRNPRHQLAIRVYSVADDGTEALITSVIASVRHTRWQRVLLPVTHIQDALDSESKVFRMRLGCASCGKGIELVLAQRRATTRPRHDRRVRRRDDQFARTGTDSKPERNSNRKQDNNGKLDKRRPYMIIHTQSKEGLHSVKKRHTPCDGFSTSSCCVKSLFINFQVLGWDNWVVAPQGYFANYCEGNCTQAFTRRDQLVHQHTSVLAQLKNTSTNQHLFNLCCGPRKLSSLSMLYLDRQGNILKTDLPNMKVDDCGCA